MKRCTGHCCEAFTLPYSPEELMAAYHRFAEGERTEVLRRDGDKQPPYVHKDILLVAPMVRYIGFLDKPPFAQVNPRSSGVKEHYYSCKHFDPKTRNCSIYEIRPSMCRRYPYGQKCNYAACTWTEQKEKKLPKSAQKKALGTLLQEVEKVAAGPVSGKVK